VDEADVLRRVVDDLKRDNKVKEADLKAKESRWRKK
jgi:hypothetical protein